MNKAEWWGIRVKVMRKAMNLTQSDLAKQTGMHGVDASTICRIEKGERIPSLDLGLALADVLGVPVHLLFTEPEASDQKAAA